jgi:hypothetical protein
MQPFLDRAHEENVPCWLEATSQHAVDVYSHFGWKLAGEVRIGDGKVGPRGWVRTADGEEELSGIRIWGMIIDPDVQGGGNGKTKSYSLDSLSTSESWIPHSPAHP